VPVSTLARDGAPICTAQAADLRQAEYFWGELVSQCEELEDRINTHQIALAKYESRGELNQVQRMRSVIRLDHRERDTLHGLLSALDERFPRLGSRGRVPQTRWPDRAFR
jgi:hypothetical protein